MIDFTFKEQSSTVLDRLFKVDKDQHLRIGWSGRSVDPAEVGDILIRPVQFRDYVMEGFVTFTLQLTQEGEGCSLKVIGQGSNRDSYLEKQIRQYIDMTDLSL